MILYFTGTGNSYYVAKRISLITEDKLVSINKILKEGGEKNFKSDKPFVIVAPTHGWRFPRIIESFIRESFFEGNNKIYFVLTCAGGVGNAREYAKKYILNKNMIFMGLDFVIMPDNYIALYDSDSRAKGKEIIKSSISHIKDIASSIKEYKKIGSGKINLIDKLNSSVTNAIFYKTFVSDKGFYTTKACVGCTKCEKLCPINNIEMKDNKPNWKSNCIHCMACIGGCPTKAIEYKKKTIGKPRYYNEEEPIL